MRQMNHLDWSHTNARIHAANASLLKKIQPSLETYGAFLVGGSLLGHERHGRGIVPWDDDVDLFVPKRDLPACVNDIEERNPALKVTRIRDWGYQILGKDGEHVDLFDYVIVDHMLQNSSKSFNRVFPRHKVPIEYAFPLKRSTFMGVEGIFVPRFSSDVLEFQFPEWQKRWLLTKLHVDTWRNISLYLFGHIEVAQI